mgnify:CR=1 FL=1
MQEVTIIIPNYNGKSLLENCFRTLENQSYKDFKVLVVDNGSTDGSTDIKSDVLDVEWIALNENLGFCGAVNLAVQKTGTPYVILLNNDTETDKYFVEWLLRGIKKSDHIFSCGAQMIDYKNHEILDNAGDLYTAMGWAVARGKGRLCKDYETSKRVFSCCAGAAIYRMDIMRKIGGLDEKHFAYLEDVEEELDADFGDTEFETLNGYLTNILGHIPTDKDVDTSIKAIGYCFTILSIGNKTIGKVKVERDNNVAV